MRHILLGSVLLCSVVLAGCKTLSEPNVQTQCAQAIDAASQQLHASNAQVTTAAWVDAAHLITSAQLKSSKQDYLNCIQDAQKAQKLLK